MITTPHTCYSRSAARRQRGGPGFRRPRFEQLERRHLLSITVPLLPEDPPGGLIYDQTADGHISAAGETDPFAIELDDGQTVTLVVGPEATLQPSVALFGPGDQPIGRANTGAAGQHAVLQVVPTNGAGVYSIEVAGLSGTTGAYALRLILNSAVKEELHGGPANDDAGSAQDLDAAFFALPGGSGQRAAVLAVNGPVGTGLLGRYYLPGVTLEDFPDFDALLPVHTRVDPQVSFPSVTADFGGFTDLDDDFAVRWTGQVLIEQRGDVTFFVESDDGSRLFVDDQLVVDNGGTHGMVERSGQVTLTSGYHDLRLEFFERGDGTGVILRYDPVNGPKQTIPAESLTPAPTTPTEDWFRFSLNDGQSAGAALTTLTPGDLTLEWFDGTMTPLAEGFATPNVDGLVSQFVDVTADGTEDNYFARISGDLADYSFVVTRNAVFETESNDDPTAAGELTVSGTALGALGDGYSVSPVRSEYVVHVSIDGMGAVYLEDLVANDPETYSTFQRLADEGAYTYDSRSDYYCTFTLPGHTSILTGRPVLQPAGQPNTVHHNWTLNVDPLPGVTIHNNHPDVDYVASVFDVVHDHGLSTSHFAGKTKFSLFEDGYDEVNGAPDENPIGGDNGPNKIDVSTIVWNTAFLFEAFMTRLETDPSNYSFLHLRDADAAGHWYGWGSERWNATIAEMGARVGRILDLIEASPVLGGKTSVIVTTDHGGSGRNHNDAGLLENYKIPMFVWGPGVEAGADLYELDPYYYHPDNGRPDYDAALQPIRNGDTGNLALEMLRLPPIPGSSIGTQRGDAADYYRVEVNAADQLIVETFTPAGGPGEFVNGLDPAIELYDSQGNLAAASDDDAADGRNALLSHRATASGTYTVRVAAAGGTGGEYVVSVRGHSGAAPAFEASDTDWVDGSAAAATPSSITVEFNDGLRLTTLDASDVTIDAIPATAVTVIDGRTAIFELPPATEEGTHEVAISAGAIKDLQGTPVEAFSTRMITDRTPPRVIASSIREGDVVPVGILTYTARFDEPLRAETLDKWDVTLTGVLSGSHLPGLFDYDPDASMLTLQYSGLPEDAFSLQLRSGNDRFEDLAGNDLDGEPLVFPLPPNVSGDGTPGGRFVVNFTADVDVVPFPVPLEAKAPLGSLVYDGSASTIIAAPGDTDNITIDVDAGQTITLVVEPAAALQPTIELLDPGSNSIGSAAAGAAGEDAVLQVVSTNGPGTYTVTIGGAGETTGSYTLQAILNAAMEEEEHDGPTNDDDVSAQDLDSTFIALGGSAERGAVLGSLPPASDIVMESEDFDSGAPGGRWAIYSSLPAGRIQVTGEYGTAGGTYALLMDRSPEGSYNLNEAVWTVDLSAIPDPTLSFFHAEWADEGNFFGGDFTDHYNADGVAISDDGVNWHPVWNAANQSDGVWQQYTIDLDTEAAAAGMTLGPNFQIKFQQYDNYAMIQDGRGYDQIAITTPAFSEDWYRFSLEDGQSATLALTAPTPGDLTLELYDEGLKLLATGVAAENVDQVANNFMDTTGNAGADAYFARVSGADVDYSLVVTLNAEFDTEPNNDLAPNARDVTRTGTVSGAIGGGITPPVTFAAPGDFGTGDQNERAVANMLKGWDPEFVITTGDNNCLSLAVGSPDWRLTIGDDYGSFIKGRSDNRYPEQTSPTQRFFPVVGNHDSWGGTSGAGNGGDISGYLDYLHNDPAGGRLPDGVHDVDKSYYDFRWGPIHLFAVDSDHVEATDAFGTTQIEWLRQGLLNSTATWKFVYFHHPPFSSSSQHGSSPQMQWPFQQWGADAVFAGHDHVYERILLDDVAYFTTALGGRPRYSFGSPVPGSEVRYSDDFGSMRITVDGGRTTFEFLSIDDGANGGNGGRLIDSYTIYKPAPPQADTVDYYSVEVNAGDVLTVETSTPGDGPGAFVNELDPAIELYDPTGTPVADDDNGADDGRNALMTHTAGTSGMYTVRVAAAADTTGEYVLAVSGHTGMPPAPEVVAMDPADGALLPQSPSQITVDFNHGLLLSSLDASDLTVGGVPASAVVTGSNGVVDGDTVVFELPVLSEGLHDVAVAAGAMLDLQSTPIEPYSGTLTIDTTAPRVTASSILQGQTVTIAAGDAWQYTARFDEKLFAAGLDPSDVTLAGDVYATYQPDSITYDPVDNEVNLEFSGLVPDNYTLTLRSGNGHFEDLAGNDLDGEPAATTVPSGDGNPGGDFTVRFTLEAIGVVGRHVLYNNSALNDPDLGAADDDAIAPDKTALLPGGTATFANYTSYNRGINGIVVDIAGLPNDVTPSAADFRFLVGNDSTPGDWDPAPVPKTVTFRPGAGQYGSDRVTIVWPDNSVHNTWLETTVLPANLGPNTGDVFYFGNAVAEAGNTASNARVTVADLLLARNNPRDFVNPADVTYPHDYNRDTYVNAIDVLLARNSQTNFLNELKLIDLSNGAEEARGAPLADLAWLSEFDQANVRQRPAEKDSAAEAVDQLLAIYWF